ncbi:MAG: GAF domain-containing protein [candidate division Zixibacteria bacterium]|nr:GAF domain-containing protein [candidate division Zixibacteria bacterium]
MENQAINLAIALLFLSALIIVYRSKHRLMARNGDIYYNISSGLGIIALVAVARLCNYVGFFTAVPFLSEPLFFKLASWIAIITGVVLMASGVSGWMEIGRHIRGTSDLRNNRDDLLRQIEQLATVENRVSVILKTTLEHIVQRFEISEGAVFIPERQSRKMRFLSGVNALQMDVSHLQRIDITPVDVNNSNAKEQHLDENINLDIPSGTNPPSAILPVRVNNKLAAVVLLWADSASISNEDMAVLKLAMEVVGRTLANRKQQIEIEYLKNRNSEIDRLRSIINFGGNFDDNVVKIAHSLKELFGTEYVSFTVAYSSRDSSRFTVGQNGTLLSEKGLDTEWKQEISKTNWDSNSPLVVNSNMSNIPQFIQNILSGIGIKELVVIPLREGGHTMAVLLLSQVKETETSYRNFEILKGMTPIFNRLVRAEINRYDEEQFLHRHSLINHFMKDCTKEPKTQQLYQEAANILLRELRTSVVRISTFEGNGIFLKSRALSLSHTAQNIVPDDGYMIMSLMPFHRLVQNNGRLMIIDQENSNGQMSQAEAEQMYNSVLRSALLVPIIVGQKVNGIISLAERRKRERFRYTSSDIIFVSSIAATLALAMSSGKLSEVEPYEREQTDKTPTMSDMRRPIESSLSEIIG